MSTTGLRNHRPAVFGVNPSPQDPCARRIMFGALRPIDYRQNLLERMISRWNLLR